MKRRCKMLLICSLLIALCGCGKAGERADVPVNDTPASTASQQLPTEAPAVESTQPPTESPVVEATQMPTEVPKVEATQPPTEAPIVEDTQPEEEVPGAEKEFCALDYVTLADYYDIWLYANRIGMDETGMNMKAYEFFFGRAKDMNLDIEERTYEDVICGVAPNITDDEVRMLGMEGVETGKDFSNYVCRMVNGLYDSADYLNTENWFMGQVVDDSVIRDIPDEKVKEFEAHYLEFFETKKSLITPEELEVSPNCMYEDEEYTTNCAQKVLVAMAIAETEGMEDFSYEKVVDFLVAYAEESAY